MLFGVVRRLVGQGRAVLYISHRLGEVFELARRASVLKDGRLVGTIDLASQTPAGLVRMMVGRTMTGYYPPRHSGMTGPVRLAVSGMRAGMLRDVDLDVRGGEIVGVTGLDGSGRTELGRALFGAGAPAEGRIEVDGRPVRLRTPRAAARAGLAYLTADRKSEGLVLPLPARDNALLPVRARSRRATRAAGTRLAGLAARTGLAEPALRRETRLLSGGNQQKVVLVKWLATGAGVYVFDEPTRGIDVGAKAGIHRLMRELAGDGAAIVMISSELPEVIGMSDRILVMREGRIAGELPADTDEAGIMLLAAGQAGEVA
jgi:ribose transport system ATP-binding protein